MESGKWAEKKRGLVDVKNEDGSIAIGWFVWGFSYR